MLNFIKKKNTQKVILIGDSHARALQYSLNEEIKNNNLSLFRFPTRMYLRDFNFVNRKTKKIEKEYVESNAKIENFLKENSNLIVILHQRWSAGYLETHFDNEEGFKEMSKLKSDSYYEPINVKTSSLRQRQEYIKKGLISQINNIINQGHKLILVYPVPEMGFDVLKQLKNKYVKDKFTLTQSKPPIISVSYEVFKKRNESMFEILDNIKNSNIYRVYPHKLFCDNLIENRCIANDEKTIFYYDDDHLSIQGSKLVVDEIFKKIEKIKF